MRAKELRDMEDRELTKQVAVLRQDLFGLRFANATGELDDTARLGRVKRDLARALTVARERLLALDSAPAASGSNPAEQQDG
jgi:large subunit ribosomal protein L29